MRLAAWTQRYFAALFRYRFWIMALMALGVVALAPLSLRVRVASKFSDYYPSSYTQLYRRFAEMLKPTSAVLVLIEVKEGTIYASEVIRKIHRITVDLIETKGVNPHDVLSLTHPRLRNIQTRTTGINIQPIVPRPEEAKTQADLEKIRKAVYTNPGVRGFYVSADNKVALIRAGFWDSAVDPLYVAERLEAIAKREEDANTRIYVTGPIILAAWLIRHAPKFLALFLASPLVALFLFGLFLGSWRAALLLLLGTSILTLGTLSGVGALGLSLEPLELLVFFLLFARTASHTAAWVVHCQEAYQRQPSPFTDPREKVVEEAFWLLWKPLTLALVADMVGFLSILLSDLPMVRNLALVGTFWLLGLLVLNWTLIPFLCFWLRPWNPSLERTWGDRLADAWTTVLFRLGSRQKLVGWGAALVLILGGVSAFNLKAGREMLGTTLLPSSHPYNRAFSLASKHFMGVHQLVVIATAQEGSSFRQLAALRQIEAFQNHMALGDHFGVSLAVTDLAKAINRMFHEGIPKWAVLPEDSDAAGQLIFRIVVSATAPGEVERFLAPDLKTVAVTCLYRDYSPEIVARAVERAQDFVARHPSNLVDFHLAGGIFGLLFALNREVLHSYWQTLLAVVLAGLGLSTLAWGNLREGVRLGALLVLCQAVVLAALSFGKIDLNVYSLPLVLMGMGLTLYAFFPREETYRARVLTALALLPAVLLWTFSPLRFQAEMGGLLALTFLSNAVFPVVFSHS